MLLEREAHNITNHINRVIKSEGKNRLEEVLIWGTIGYGVYLINDLHKLSSRCKLYYNSSTRKINIAKATELCPEDHIKCQNRFTIEQKSLQRGWRQWLLELYGKVVYLLG